MKTVAQKRRRVSSRLVGGEVHSCIMAAFTRFGKKEVRRGKVKVKFLLSKG
jgi:hypothetical protein